MNSSAINKEYFSNEIPQNNYADDETYNGSIELHKADIFNLLILTIITLGFYLPIWFLKRREAINQMQSKYKLGSSVFVFVIIFFSLDLLLNVLLAYWAGFDQQAPVIFWARDILRTIASMILLVQSFKVRRIFHDHFNEYLQQGISFSKIATFFFTIFYLQYKINNIN